MLLEAQTVTWTLTWSKRSALEATTLSSALRVVVKQELMIRPNINQNLLPCLQPQLVKARTSSILEENCSENQSWAQIPGANWAQFSCCSDSMLKCYPSDVLGNVRGCVPPPSDDTNCQDQPLILRFEWMLFFLFKDWWFIWKSERDSFYPLVHIPDGFSGHGWAKSKPRVSSGSSRRVAGAQTLEPSSTVFPRPSTGHWIRSAAAGTETGTHIGYQPHRHRWQPYLVHHSAILDAFLGLLDCLNMLPFTSVLPNRRPDLCWLP